jgi:hypothetical protein
MALAVSSAMLLYSGRAVREVRPLLQNGIDPRRHLSDESPFVYRHRLILAEN